METHIKSTIKIILSIMLALLVTGTGAVFAEGEQDTVPDEQPVEQEEQPSVYVLMADDKEVLTTESTEIVFNSKDEGKLALKEAVDSLVPDGYKKTSQVIKEKISYKKVNQGLLRSGSTVLTHKKTVSNLKKLIKSKKSPITVKVSYVRYKFKKTPKRVKFKYKSNMYDFEFKVASKGTNGLERIKLEQTNTNGKKSSWKKKATKTVKKGKYTIVYTGRKNTPKNLKTSNYKTYKAKVIKNTMKNFGNVFLGRDLVAYAKKFLGNPYRVGGMSLTNGIDCVGFIRALYKKFGITVPGNRWKLYRYGKVVSYKNARAGDVVFYGPHPAIYMGNGKIISARKSGIRISKIGYKKWTYIRRFR